MARDNTAAHIMPRQAGEAALCPWWSVAILFLMAVMLPNPTPTLPQKQLVATRTAAKAFDDSGREGKMLSMHIEQRPLRSIKTINLIGERHSGTKWITKHLKDCFGDQVKVLDRYTRYKHWFQYDDTSYPDANSSLVVAMFRDPYGASFISRNQRLSFRNRFFVSDEICLQTGSTPCAGDHITRQIILIWIGNDL